MASPWEEAQSPLDSPSPPTSPESIPDGELQSSPLGSPSSRRMTAPRTTSDMGSAATVSNMNPSSTPLGTLNAARGKPPPTSTMGGRGAPMALNPDLMAKMKAFSVSRQNPPAQPQPNRLPVTPGGAPPPGPAAGGFPPGFKLPPQLQRPGPHAANSSPAVPGTQGPKKGLSLAEKRGMKLPGGLPGAPAPTAPPAAGGRQKPKMTLTQMGAGSQPNGEQHQNGDQAQQEKPKEQSQMDKYAEFIDTKTGALKFKGKAVVHGSGIDFSSGRSFSISLDEVDTLDELGKGNYGTVYKVRHSRPKFRRTGQGLAGNKARGPNASDDTDESPTSPTRSNTGGATGVIMAMKEIRLELDDAKFAAIIMELDILHRCMSPHIVDFYGAFFQEGAVYICMEFMNGGSCDRIYGDGIPEHVLRKITLSTVLGLKSLKEEHNIIHRDVKPTNILINTKGQVKICDFGVSGNLVASIARTNIGCQSYMAPERISSGGVAQAGAPPSGGTYSVQSDIWSLGLTIIECALGRYPYPPETYDNIFSQLSAIVDGEPPDLPADNFSQASRDFVAGCLNKIPKLRPTYPMLLQHAWLAPIAKPETIIEEDEEAAEAADAANAEIPAPQNESGGGTDAGGEEFVDREVGEWVLEAIDRRRRGVMGKAAKPALHAAPLDATGVGSPAAEVEKPKVEPVAVDGTSPGYEVEWTVDRKLE
ncbi:MAP kinase kinase Wis1 [Vermiconidia calcicola]|uniref:MAP kinase kinase Wis1 n=1 Tax=Vermiconidia calcicola TaxID=1690605 RepID=A0ACC3MPH5_9PEZI|nr:MAP kinase kinase Wis1 [Vermiconidia calcicola]